MIITVNHVITVRWDDAQFQIIQDLLMRGKEDPAKLQQLADELKASQTALQEAMAKIQS